MELAFARADGTEVPVLLSANPVIVGDEQLTVVLAHDISERKHFEEQLVAQATHDDLTGLPNRADLRGQLERTCRLSAGGRGFGVLFCDLDRFKQVNDAFGHDRGDELLVQVANRLREEADCADTVARLGGDEFVVLVESAADEAGLSRLAERIVRAFGEPFTVGDAEVWVTISVGQLWTVGEADPAEVLRRADVAMYRAKAVGRNRVEVFDREVQASVEHRAEVERRLRRGLSDGEIVGFLQPFVDLASGEVVGAELLARWRRPDGTMVSPVDFIPVAEESGLVVDLGRRMLRQACELLVARQRRGARPVRLNVNVSGIHVLAGDLVGDVTGILAQTGAPAHLLTIELTESRLMDDADEAVRRLEMIRELGVGLAIDDFGTGYSSLGYLQQLPVDTVKVDKGFVDGLGVDRGRTAIVEATVSLGATFGLKVVAEGVETEDQAAALRRLGCGYAQGWLFGRPMPSDDFELFVDMAPDRISI
jgi:diguanylate cyclase (GGDEF)-like protein